MAGEQDAPRSRRRIWLWIALAASVGVNMVIVGMVAGFLLRGDHGGGGPGAVVSSAALRGISHALPPPERARAREAIAMRDDEISELRRRSRETRRRTAELLRAETLDRAALAQSMAASRALNIEARRLVEETMLDIIDDLPQETRAAIADHLESRRHRRRDDRRSRREERAGAGATE